MVAIGLVVVGLLFLSVQVQSPSMLYWTGQPVQGTARQGLVFYAAGGEQYTLDNTGPDLADGTRVTVYVDRADPSHALLLRPAKWVDAGAVSIWFVAAAALLVLAPLRRAWRRRRTEDHETLDWITQYRSRATGTQRHEG